VDFYVIHSSLALINKFEKGVMPDHTQPEPDYKEKNLYTKLVEGENI